MPHKGLLSLPLASTACLVALVGACLLTRGPAATSPDTLTLADLAFLTHGLWLPDAVVRLGALLAGALFVACLLTVPEGGQDEVETHFESRMQAIAGVGNLIVSTLDRNQLLEEIVSWVEGELDAPAVSILLMDDDRRSLRFEVASGEKGQEVKSFSVELGQGIAGTVAATGEPLIVNDARHDPRQAREIAEAIDFPTQTIICVPMKLHGQVTGVIEALNKRSGQFTAYDEALLTVIAQQAALFLESARLYSEMQQRVDEATAELRAANQDLRTQKATIETLVDEMASGVIATDGDDCVLAWNRAAHRLLGTPESEALGKPVLDLIAVPELAELFAVPITKRDSADERTSEIELLVDGENVTVRASVTPVAAADGGLGRLALLTDITRLKQLDRVKSDLISFVSHELKNPLATITGFAQLLQRQIGEESPSAQLVGLLNQQASRMQWLIEDFLDISRIDAGVALEMRWEEIDSPALLIQQIVGLQAASTEDHKFVVDVSDDVPAMRADAGKIEQVLVNLISNAIKYSPQGGQITVTVRLEDPGVLLITVTDEGMGIKPDDLANLFQRFRRAPVSRERVRGTGIGLFLSRHLVEAHGGRIWAESGEGGSTFSFTLPIQPPQEDSVPPNAPADAAEDR